MARRKCLPFWISSTCSHLMQWTASRLAVVLVVLFLLPGDIAASAQMTVLNSTICPLALRFQTHPGLRSTVLEICGSPITITIGSSKSLSPVATRRQIFIPQARAAHHSTTVLINRINLFWGTRWRAEPANFDERTLDRANDTSLDLLIACVDTRASRAIIDSALTMARNRTAYWLDLGNNAASGQFVLGQPLNARNRRKAGRLRTVSELYPEIIDAEGGEDPLPSCSAVEALDRQEPFINQTLASSALAMLARLFRYGKLTHHGGFFNAQSGLMSPLPVDPQLWSKTRRRARRP